MFNNNYLSSLTPNRKCQNMLFLLAETKHKYVFNYGF